MKIYRYTLDKREKTIQLPRGFRVLDAQYQRENISVWVQQDTDGNHELLNVKFTLVRTDEELPTDWKYVSTVQMPDEYDEFDKLFSFVYHVFYTFE